MLDQADELIERYHRSSAAKRRAVSTAYYAAFHWLLWHCAQQILPGEDANSVEFERVYRALDHGTLKNAFNGNVLKGNSSLNAIGTDFIQLQEARIKADYTPPRRNVFALSEAKEHLARAREIIAKMQDLNDADRQVLAIHLLFPSRKK
ncbi:hypothetical protein Q8W71_04290 [Methylobacterium sp. NEAU 140]|uniref:hypothetical protein n=1 Tax=Methylobacterium sp. NEAU 140 TaxID=3064945 RepID=UPI0027336E4A|nr:hypothetical protein [Methylobacterium sp. NEAU 140]MDP4021836.1 hypothetical protein [Methylobacterium sp. NEAU 140]